MIEIEIVDASGVRKAQAQGECGAELVYEAAYVVGDRLRMRADQPAHVVALLEDSLPPVLGWLAGEYEMEIPFGERRASYSPKSFSGQFHALKVRAAQRYEVAAYRNVAFNPLDCHTNAGFFPHAVANIETRGEAVFAARNAIDGNTCSAGHGNWPYESWGINRRDDAELRIHFGRSVRIDRLRITLRADFPHDNWWKRAVIRFSDGSQVQLSFRKSGQPQDFEIAPRTTMWLQIEQMIKDADDPSPFPALIQLEAWGSDA